MHAWLRFFFKGSERVVESWFNTQHGAWNLVVYQAESSGLLVFRV